MEKSINEYAVNSAFAELAGQYTNMMVEQLHRLLDRFVEKDCEPDCGENKPLFRVDHASAEVAIGYGVPDNDEWFPIPGGNTILLDPDRHVRAAMIDIMDEARSAHRDGRPIDSKARRKEWVVEHVAELEAMVRGYLGRPIRNTSIDTCLRYLAISKCHKCTDTFLGVPVPMTPDIPNGKFAIEMLLRKIALADSENRLKECMSWYESVITADKILDIEYIVTYPSKNGVTVTCEGNVRSYNPASKGISTLHFVEKAGGGGYNKENHIIETLFSNNNAYGAMLDRYCIENWLYIGKQSGTSFLYLCQHGFCGIKGLMSLFQREPASLWEYHEFEATRSKYVRLHKVTC